GYMAQGKKPDYLFAFMKCQFRLRHFVAENARLMARIKGLEQIAKEKDELEVRIVELEQTTKLTGKCRAQE
ncbi:5634_t:CDS:2, partial [Dentiscutata heterogama]